MEKIKVLSLGLSQINFLEQLFKKIKIKEDHFSFYADNFVNHTNIEPQKGIIDGFYNFEAENISFFNGILYFFKSLRRKLFWKQFFLELHLKGIRSLWSFIKENSRNLYIVEKKILPLDFDVYHFNSMVKPRVKYAQYLPNDKNIVCSFWGLDLYQRSGVNNNYYTGLALKKANVITVQSIEMKEVVMAKFGRTLEEKIKVITFPLSKTIFELIDYYKTQPQKIDGYKNKLGIPKDKIVLSVGYNAASNARHIEILKELENLSPALKQKLVIVLPLTYGRDDSYLKDLNACISKLSYLDVITIDDYMDWQDLALLKVSIDVVVQLPKNDALSSAVLEVMYAGGIGVLGAWLPYGVYKRTNIHHEEIAAVNELGMAIESVCSNLKTIKEHCKNNSVFIKEKFLSEKIDENWISIYKT
ncbi:MAG: hypothetical protein HRT67_02655 [Flavobacteriaceae bacterium]|nr:hypothetical protein [Flavobacteriaceae bacterium]